MTLLARVAELYRGLSAYSDTGTVSTPSASVKFETTFRRGTYFHFAYSDILPGRQGREMGRVTWDRGQLEFWTPFNVPPPPTLGLAIAGLAGVSSGAAHGISSLLLPDEVGGWIPTDLKEPKLDDVLLDGISCLRVSGRHPWFPEKVFSLFIDPGTLLIQRRTGPTDDEVTTYDAVTTAATELP